jgi:hypothetical protein
MITQWMAEVVSAQQNLQTYKTSNGLEIVAILERLSAIESRLAVLEASVVVPEPETE